MSKEIPAPKFQHFERVVIIGKRPGCEDYRGERGTILWLESSAVRKNPDLSDQWLYVVYLQSRAVWRTFFQSDLESEGSFEPESAHLGKRPEISFDLVVKEDNAWMEGSYRLPDEFWKVVIFRKCDVPELRSQMSKWQRPTKWEREITGVVIHFPQTAKMGPDDLIRAMTQVFGRNDWVQVGGPDSMMLR